LTKSDDVSFGICYGCNQHSAADIFDVLLHLRPRVQQQSQTALDVVNVIKGRHSRVVAFGNQAYVLVSDLESDIIRLVCIWLNAQKLAEYTLSSHDVLNWIDDCFDALIHVELLIVIGW